MKKDIWKSTTVSFFLMLSVFLFLTSTAAAEYFFDVGTRGTYESNINGSPADADKKGDFYAGLFAGGGGYRQVARDTFLFLRGDVAGYRYATYDDLNSFIGGMSVGGYKGFGDILSAQLSLKARIKDYKGSPRDSLAFGGTFELKQQITPKFWIKEGYEYEGNNADSVLFSYKGHSVGIWSGYMITPKTMANLGYSYLIRKYDDPSGFESKTHTLSVGLVQELVRKVYLFGGYDRQYNDSNVANTNFTNNLFTIGLTYSF